MEEDTLELTKYDPRILRLNEERRFLFVACTKSGKTYNIVRIITTHEKDFDAIFIMSPSSSIKAYKAIDSPIIRCINIDDKKDMKTCDQVEEELENIYKCMDFDRFVEDENANPTEKKEPIKKDRILIVLDDVCDSGLMKKTIYEKLIKNWRHFGVSVFLVSQYPNIMINQLTKANIDAIFIFRTNNARTVSYFKGDFIKQAMKLAIRDQQKRKGKKMTVQRDEDINKMCELLYYGYVCDKTHGFICISYSYNDIAEQLGLVSGPDVPFFMFGYEEPKQKKTNA